MSKLLNSVLEKVSENNNEYRTNLRSLNGEIDERTTALVSDLVTSSGYILDFSKTLETAKDMLINPISRIVESYVIRDLRSVESVNEQFIEKINDKIESSDISSQEERDSFVKNLDTLLNNKYTEIVNIKRTPFFENGKNEEIEEKINSFIEVMNGEAEFDATYNEIIDAYRSNLYTVLEKTLNDIGKLYQDNFINEIEANLNISVNHDEISDNNDLSFEPTISNIPEIPDFDSKEEQLNPVIPEIPEEESREEKPLEENSNIPEMPTVSDDITSDVITADIPEMPNFEEEIKETEPVKIDPILPVEIDDNAENELDKDDEVEETEHVETKEKAEEVKHSYDIDEILKIAKSPILDMPEEKKEDSYVNVEPITIEKEEMVESEYNAGEIVEEMINRLKARLDVINNRRNSILEEREKIEEDEQFVNDLITSSRSKKEELDSFEVTLDNKEKELEEKQKELDEKINRIMPFANAVLQQEES